MRRPNPPSIQFGDLAEDEIREVVKLALLVVEDLAKGKEWDALEKYQYARMDMEKKLAFWSLLDSHQRRMLKELEELAKWTPQN